jgi:hypothetical protein
VCKHALQCIDVRFVNFLPFLFNGAVMRIVIYEVVFGGKILLEMSFMTSSLSLTLSVLNKLCFHL